MKSRDVVALALLSLSASCADPPVVTVPAPTRPSVAALPSPSPASPAPAAVASNPAGAAPELPPIPSGDVVVVLSAGGERTAIEVSVQGRGRVEAADGATAPLQGENLRVRFEGAPGGLLRSGQAPPTTGAMRVVAETGPGFLLDGKPYAGSLTVSAGRDGTLLLRNTLPFPDYLAGVLASELYPDSPSESLRALAILARSFALAHLAELTDDPGQHQAYRGVPAAAGLPALRAAVASTEGLRLVLPTGDPLPGYWYHSTCGGHTADATSVFGAPASAAYAGVACAHCTTSKYFRWESEIPEADLRRALGFESAVRALSVERRSPDGRVLLLEATPAKGKPKSVAALALRSGLGPNRLRSTMLSSVEAVPGSLAKGAPPRAFLFRGKGWGHGVGLCQVGAMNLARSGRSAEEILALYYPGSRLVRVGR